MKKEANKIPQNLRTLNNKKHYLQEIEILELFEEEEKELEELTKTEAEKKWQKKEREKEEERLTSLTENLEEEERTYDDIHLYTSIEELHTEIDQWYSNYMSTEDTLKSMEDEENEKGNILEQEEKNWRQLENNSFSPDPKADQQNTESMKEERDKFEKEEFPGFSDSTKQAKLALHKIINDLLPIYPDPAELKRARKAQKLYEQQLWTEEGYGFQGPTNLALI